MRSTTGAWAVAILAVSGWATASASTIYVDDSAPPGGNGATWATAFNSPNSALDLAAVPANGVTEIRIGQGTYRPDTGPGRIAGNRDESFRLQAGVPVRGGFAGHGAADPNLRDIVAFPTVLTGDLLGNDSGSSNNGENSYHVVKWGFLIGKMVLDGVTVRGGNSTGESQSRAGALWIANGEPLQAVDCVFVSNDAGGDGTSQVVWTNGRARFERCEFRQNFGGGLDCTSVPAEIVDCHFVGNTGTGLRCNYSTVQSCTFTGNLDMGIRAAISTIVDCEFNDNVSAEGGAIYAVNASRILRCEFVNNQASSRGGAILADAGGRAPVFIQDCQFSMNSAVTGGAIAAHDSEEVFIDRCLFSSNLAVNGGGAIAAAGSPMASLVVRDSDFLDNIALDFSGGAISSWGGQIMLLACRFVGNSAMDGGGLTAPTQTPGNFHSVTAWNCVFAGNSAANTGGAIRGGECTLVGCVFSGNSAVDGGAMWSAMESDVTASNCTFSGNTATGRGGGVFYSNISGPVTLTLTNSILWGNSDGDPGTVESAQVFIEAGAPTASFSCVEGGWTGAGTSNISLDPLFIDPNGADNTFGTLDDDVRVMPGAPVINAGTAGVVPAVVIVDVGGLTRVVGAIDMGAHEAGGAAPPDIIHVDDDASVGGAGASWPDAMPDLYDALTAALLLSRPSLEVRIAGGVYVPQGWRDQSFFVYSGIRLRGGFAGMGAPDPDARDFVAHQTILSGDRLGDDAPNGVNRQDNSFSVVACLTADDTSLVEGVTARGGASGPGAGLLMVLSDTVVSMCRFEDNHAQTGAGCSIEAGKPAMVDCVFAGNRNFGSASGAMGMGLSVTSSAHPQIVRCQFVGNQTPDKGGGVYLDTPHVVRLEDCLVQGNSAVLLGGGVYLAPFRRAEFVRCKFFGNSVLDEGGAFYCPNGEPVFLNCRFGQNSASQRGGAISFGAGAGAPLVVNCGFSGNTAGRGGATYYQGAIGAFPQIVNCAFSANTASIDGGAHYNASSGPLTFANCILYGNSPNQVFQSAAVVVVRYSCIQGGWGGAGTQNTSASPLFLGVAGVDGMTGTMDDDFRVGIASPCRNTGNNPAVPLDVADLDGDGNVAEQTPVDLYERPRIAGPNVDMGVFEQAYCPADLNVDGVVNSIDLAILLGAWSTATGDQNGDGVVNSADLAAMLGSWGPCPT